MLIRLAAAIAFTIGVLVVVSMAGNIAGNIAAHPQAVSMSGNEAPARKAETNAAVNESVETALDAGEEAEQITVADTGDVNNGRKIFRRKCKTCHTSEKDDKNRTGPNLWNIVGRDKASAEDFSYSTTMKTMGGVWTEANIKSLIAHPRSFVPDTKMAFAGLKDASERDDILAYLKTLKD